MGKICVECEDPSWTGQDPIVAPELPVDGGGVKVVDELPETGQKGMAYVLVDDIEAPTTSQGIFVYDEGWLLTAQPVSEAVQIVEELPEEGQLGVLYYVPKAGDDTYDLYRWVDDNWIKVDTDVKLYNSTGQNTDGSMTQKAVTGIVGQARVLSSADYNDPVANPTRVNLFLLPPGLYYVQDTSTNIRFGTTDISNFDTKLILLTRDSITGAKIIQMIKAGSGDASYPARVCNAADAPATEFYLLSSFCIKDNLTTSSNNGRNVLSAYQGYVLNTKIGDLSTLTTTNKTSTVAAINEIVTSVGNVGTALQTLTIGNGV